MARIPFPQGLSESEDLPRTKKFLLNVFIDSEGKVKQRPGVGGLSSLDDALSLARGSFRWNEFVYKVFGNRLIKIVNETTGEFVDIGSIAGSDLIRTAIGFNDAVIVVRNGAIYTLDKSDDLTEISSQPNFVSCVDVVHIDSRFVYCPADGSPVFFSDVGQAANVQAASFFDAEVLPDLNNGLFVLGNYLGITGTDSIELFTNQGASPVPFVRVTGGGINNGLIGGLLDYGDTFFFIGRKREQNPAIFAIGSGAAPKISNEAIDLILFDYTLLELEQAITSRFIWRGNDIATFTLPRDSFMFLNGKWSILDSSINGDSVPWAGGFITELNNQYFTAYKDQIGKLEKINSDFGENFERGIQFGIESEDLRTFTIESLEPGISQGFNNAVGSIYLRTSTNGVNFRDPVGIKLGNIGEYEKKLIWSGLGTYDGFAALVIFTREDVLFNMEYLKINSLGKLQLS